MLIKKLTQAIQNGLILNEKSDDKDNTYSCDYINKMNEYSTKEVKTNKVWIDGKPIYRMCIDIGTITTTGNKTITHTAKNIDRYTDVRAIGNSGTSYYNVPFTPNVGMFNSASFSIRTISPTELQLYASVTGHSFVAIIEYTKTTD